MLTSNPDDYEFGYTYAPGRFDRRKSCFVVSGIEGGPASTIHFTGYGRTPKMALLDLGAR